MIIFFYTTEVPREDSSSIPTRILSIISHFSVLIRVGIPSKVKILGVCPIMRYFRPRKLVLQSLNFPKLESSLDPFEKLWDRWRFLHANTRSEKTLTQVYQLSGDGTSIGFKARFVFMLRRSNFWIFGPKFLVSFAK